jgi:ElaB/YqjD/DUF883 family membrane-anchored ribosome-binding protein
LIDDLNAVTADVETLLKATADQGGEKLAVIRAKVEESLRIAKARMAKSQAMILVKTKVAGRAALMVGRNIILRPSLKTGESSRC